MLPCQRALFDIPREVCFLNAASWSPLPLAVQEAGRAAVARKGQPWKLPADFQPQQYERARKAAAALIGADSVDVSLIPSVGYGVATAGKVLTIPRGSRVLVLQDDHTSPVLEWMSRAQAGGFTGVAAADPATVFHFRTRQRVTRPLRTYGSRAANASAVAGESLENSRTAPSTGSSSAPPRTSSPRSCAVHASARCSSLNAARRST